jgi:hypothetical protein
MAELDIFAWGKNGLKPKESIHYVVKGIVRQAARGKQCSAAVMSGQAMPAS